MRLYNTTRGPLAVTLNNGITMIFRAKHWTEVQAGQEACSLIFHYINKGLLHKEIVMSEDISAVVETPKEIEKKLVVEVLEPDAVVEITKLIELPEIPKEVVQSEDSVIEQENNTDNSENINKKRKKAKEI